MEIAKAECKRCKNLYNETLVNSSRLCVYCKADEVDKLPSPVVKEEVPTAKKSESDMAREELALRILTRKRLLPFVERFNHEYLAG